MCVQEMQSQTAKTDISERLTFLEQRRGVLDRASGLLEPDLIESAVTALSGPRKGSHGGIGALGAAGGFRSFVAPCWTATDAEKGLTPIHGARRCGVKAEKQSSINNCSGTEEPGLKNEPMKMRKLIVHKRMRGLQVASSFRQDGWLNFRGA